MDVVMIAAECAPAAKAGGLGDVVFGLSHELERRGQSVEVVLPKYAGMSYRDIWDLQVSYQDLWVPWYGGAIHCTVFFGWVHGRKCFFIEPHSADNFFAREHFYGYADDVMRFGFFVKAALEPSSALCACGARFSTRPVVQAAFRAEAGGAGASPVVVQDGGPERVGPPLVTHTQTADDATHALVLAAWPEPGPQAINSTLPHDEPAGAWTSEEINAPPQLPEGNEPEADPEPKLGAESATVVEPHAAGRSPVGERARIATTWPSHPGTDHRRQGARSSGSWDPSMGSAATTSPSTSAPQTRSSTCGDEASSSPNPRWWPSTRTPTRSTRSAPRPSACWAGHRATSPRSDRSKMASSPTSR